MESKCHCGKVIKPDHWSSEDGEDLKQIHSTRCCGCADAYAFGAPDCEQCEKEGEERDRA